MDLIQRFQNFFRLYNLQTTQPLLLAVSGGVDSVVLCELCQQAGFNFSIAHCNFGLRGAESERDESFVKNLGEKYKVEVFIKKFDTSVYAEENKLSIQEAARNLRYDWFFQLKKEKDFAFILLAHHADDNIETLLMNFFRGTGLQGITGIPEINKEILRPMLSFRRKEIVDFANEHQLKWVEDSSNSSSKYTRNFFRNELIPAIKKVYPEAEENLLDNIERFKKINSFYQSSVKKMMAELCEMKGEEVRIPIRKLKKYDYSILIYEIIKNYGFGEKQVDEVVKLMDSNSGKFIENKDFQIIKHGLWLIIASKTNSSDIIAIQEDEKEIVFNEGRLEIKIISKEKYQLQKATNIAQLDAKNIEFPLVLRRWKQGDYLYPLGMLKKKKLARFFIDQKLSKNQKENVWVLESNKKIVWIVGMRIDERFKITDSTKEVLLLNLTSPLL